MVASMLLKDVQRKVAKQMDKISNTSETAGLFQTGNVVQLISCSSGKTLQIVQCPTGQLVVDGVGPVGPQYPHAHWTVFNEGNHCVKLYNGPNYLAIANGNTQVLNIPNPAMAGVETRFHLIAWSHFMMLESMNNRSRYISILPTGELKPALVSTGDAHSRFGVSLIYSPSQAAVPAPRPVDRPPPYSPSGGK